MKSGRARLIGALGALAMIALAMGPIVAVQANHTQYGFYNGVDSHAPGSHWDAPIFRQFAFVDGRVTQYHVLTPEVFRIDQHETNIYQFPLCTTLQPVLERHDPVPGDGGAQVPHDAPTRQIVDVTLSTGCMVQPKSVDEVFELAVVATLPLIEGRPMWVNAPIIPPQLADLSDTQLFNGPPFRPRVPGWMDGHEVKFITYEVSWMPDWAASNFPSEDAQVFMISYGAMFRERFTIFNTAAGSPRMASVDSYSPIWEANCVVDADNQKCNISVNMKDHPWDPDREVGYYQCRSEDECKQMVNTFADGPDDLEHRVVVVKPNTFTHINCPMVAVDLSLEDTDGYDYIDPTEDLIFPNVWVNGPVTVA